MRASRRMLSAIFPTCALFSLQVCTCALSSFFVSCTCEANFASDLRASDTCAPPFPNTCSPPSPLQLGARSHQRDLVFSPSPPRLPARRSWRVVRKAGARRSFCARLAGFLLLFFLRSIGRFLFRSINVPRPCRPPPSSISLCPSLSLSPSLGPSSHLMGAAGGRRRSQEIPWSSQSQNAHATLPP